MRMVVDKNYSQTNELHSFLKQGNKAVIIDAFMIETFKNIPTVSGLRQAFSVLCKFQSNVEIMKTTEQINRIHNLNLSGLQKRLIDVKQTAAFPEFCKILFSTNNEAIILKRLNVFEHSNFSNRYIDHNSSHSLDKVIESMEYFRKEFINSEIKVFLEKERCNKEFLQKLSKHAFMLCANFMNNDKRMETRYDRAKNTYYFRLSVASMILMMRWLLDGGYKDKRRELLNNDMMDTIYIANASFFDGLLTNDNKAKKMLDIISTLLKLMMN